MGFPEWLEPMAATLTQERFTGPEWIFEQKFDGIRLLAFKRGSDVRLFSRNRLPQQMPAVAAAIAALPVTDAILDGEVTWPGSKVAYHVFDVLWLDGRDTTSLPLARRRELLHDLACPSPLHHVKALEISARPFTRAVGLPRLRGHWVRPEIVVQVAFIEWTVHGKLRHPRLIGVRVDKAAREVVREAP